MKILLAFILLLAVIFTNGCKEDEPEIVIPPFDYPEYLDCDFDIEKYDLLPSSLTYSPYNGKSYVYFTDSIGNILKLKISSYGPVHLTGALIKYNVVSVGDTIRYCYRSEELSFHLVNDSMDIQLSPTISARPFYALPEPGIQYDYFKIWYTLPHIDPFHSTQVFGAVIDIRTAPANYFTDNIHLAEYEVFGQIFHNVETVDYANSESKIYFNRTEGIVSFTDSTGKTWRFDHFQ